MKYTMLRRCFNNYNKIDERDRALYFKCTFVVTFTICSLIEIITVKVSFSAQNMHYWNYFKTFIVISINLNAKWNIRMALNCRFEMKSKPAFTTKWISWTLGNITFSKALIDSNCVQRHSKDVFINICVCVSMDLNSSVVVNKPVCMSLISGSLLSVVNQTLTTYYGIRRCPITNQIKYIFGG